MAHKHNRRRIRPRHRYVFSIGPSASNDGSSAVLDTEVDPPSGSPLSKSISGTPVNNRHLQRYSKSTDLMARHWHNRYVAWERRDKAQRDEAKSIEAEQYRLFGGEPGDDVTLCYKMLEYFDSMDYINS